MKTNKALAVIDMQNGFINDRNKNLPIKIQSYIDSNSGKYEYIIFFKYINKKDSNLVKRLNWNKFMDKNDPDTFICEPLIDLAKNNLIFEKNSYSIFKNKDFINFLNENNISSLDFCGVETDACVLASVFEAFDLKYDFKVITDLVDSSSEERHQCAINIMAKDIGI